MSKKATIVPGVHDLIPPDGRFTIELIRPDSGRVVKKVQGENVLMDWFRRNVASGNGGRFAPDSASSYGSVFLNTWNQYNPMQYLLQPSWLLPYSQPEGWPTPVGPAGRANWLWATASDDTPDATLHHIPGNDSTGEVTSGTKLDAAWSPDGVQLKRGGIQLASCIRSWDRTRIVSEYGLSYGNGIYRSLGIGSLINKTNGDGMRVTPSQLTTSLYNVYSDAAMASSTYMSNPAGAFIKRGCVDYEDGGVWGTVYAGGETLSRLSVDGTYTAAFVSLANHPGSGGQISHAVNGSDFWVGRNKVLYRCVKPTSNVAMTVTNTYDLAATLGSDTIYDIAVDRVANLVFLLTETKVHVINGTTGAPVSNFSHGLTANTASPFIEWSKAENQLYLGFPVTIGATYDRWGLNASAPSGNVPTSASCVIYGFTTAGAAAKSMMGFQTGYAGANNTLYGFFAALSENGCALRCQINSSVNSYILGPSMATHCLLDADFEKENSDALRITYDFDWAA